MTKAVDRRKSLLSLRFQSTRLGTHIFRNKGGRENEKWGTRLWIQKAPPTCFPKATALKPLQTGPPNARHVLQNLEPIWREGGHFSFKPTHPPSFVCRYECMHQRLRTYVRENMQVFPFWNWVTLLNVYILGLSIFLQILWFYCCSIDYRMEMEGT